MDVASPHILGRIGQRPLAPQPGGGQIVLERATARQNSSEPPDRIWIAELGGAVERLLGLGARDKIRLVQVAIERVEVVEDGQQGFRVVLRRRLAQQRQRRLSSIHEPHRVPQRHFDVRIVRLSRQRLLTGVPPGLEAFVAGRFAALIERAGSKRQTLAPARGL